MSDKTMMRISKRTNKQIQLIKLQKEMDSADDVIMYLMAEAIRLQNRIDVLLDKQVEDEIGF